MGLRTLVYDCQVAIILVMTDQALAWFFYFVGRKSIKEYSDALTMEQRAIQ